jgi:hypothetical protein
MTIPDSLVLGLVAYSEQVTLLPVLLICADPDTKRVFWKHISREMPEFKSDQATFTVKFDPAVDAIDTTNTYVRRWTELVAGYQQRRSAYPHLKQQLAEGLGLQSLAAPDVRYFQEFIDSVNDLFDRDFKALKNLYFPGAWKLGVGVYSATPQEISYQVYRIPFGKNAPLVASFAGRHFTEIWDFEKPGRATLPSSSLLQPGCDAVQTELRARAGVRPPGDAAKEFVFGFVEAALKNRQFKIAGHSLTIECLFQFLDNHGHTTGLALGDEYSLAALNYGIKVYLPVWYSLALHTWIELHGDLVRQTGVFPSFEEIAGIWPFELRPSDDQVHQFIQNNRESLVTPLIPQFFSFGAVITSIDWLLEQNITSIKRLYKPRTKTGPWIWSGFTADAIRYNVRCVIDNAFSEYKTFLERNGLSLPQSHYLDEQVSFIFAGDFEGWTGDNTPVLNSIAVRNPDRVLPKLSIIEATSGKGWEFKDKKAVINGTEFDIVSVGGTVASDLFGRSPMLTTVYAMLRHDLSSIWPRLS